MIGVRDSHVCTFGLFCLSLRPKTAHSLFCANCNLAKTDLRRHVPRRPDLGEMHDGASLLKPCFATLRCFKKK
jgi:hypothetical protein